MAHHHAKPFRRFNGDHVLTVFDNPGDFGRFINAAPSQQYSAATISGKFYGGNSWGDMMQKITEGDRGLADKARAMLHSVEAAEIATKKRLRVSSPWGRVSSGAYLAGDPMPCRRKIISAHRHAPIAIVASLNSMADVTQDDLLARRIAIAALIRRLAAERPVSLYLSRFSNCGGLNSCCLIKFPTAPMDVFRLGFLTARPAFTRGAGFAYHRGIWPQFKKFGMKYHDTSTSDSIAFAGGPAYSQRRNCAFSADLSDFLRQEVFYIPGADYADPTFTAIKKSPAEWINATTAELTAKMARA